MPITELHEQVYIIEGTTGERPLRLPLLVGEDRTVLMDSGHDSDVENLIVPSLDEVGFSIDDIDVVLVTHPDFDHQGGNSAIKQAIPDVLLACGERDRALVEDPEVIFRERYDAYREKHNHHYDEETVEFIMEQLGDPQPVDLTLTGGEHIRLGPDWMVQVLSLPGHSRGHIGLLDHRNRTVYGGDAIHGSGYLSRDGHPALCPTYLQVRPYLQTIQFLSHLDIDTYVGCHWSTKTGDDIEAFCAESRRYVRRLTQQILSTLKGGDPYTLTELCEHLGPKMGEWPEEVYHDMCYSIAGHLRDLTRRSMVEEGCDQSPMQYRIRTTDGKQS